MSESTISQILFQELKKRDATDKAAYADLVERIHGGENVDADTSLEILRLAGKTPSDLEKDVERAKRIAELQSTIDEAPALGAEQREFDEKFLAEMEAGKAELTTLQEKLNALELAAAAPHWEFRNRGQRIIDAKRELQTLLQSNLPQPEAASGPIITGDTPGTSYTENQPERLTSGSVMRVETNF
jgi:hypothetical protein